MRRQQQAKVPAGSKKTYAAPRLERLGSVTEVTLKSGTFPDTNQVTKQGMGGG